MAGRVSSPTLIGRAHELGRVAGALAVARDGQPAFILVAGEAGVGKTRFLREVVARAGATGWSVLEGGCVQVGTEGLPFGPFVEALRGLSHVLPPAELDELFGSGRAELARLMPHLLREGESTPGPGQPDSSAQGRLFEHLLLLFERLAARAPVLLVTEDVHWADRSTLELLGFLARNLQHGPIVVVVSYRSDELHRRHPLLPFLAEQERSGRAERLELSRFDRSELAELLAAILGAQPDPELVERIMARSEGNAFYAEELLAAGATSGSLPDTLREVLLARVATLSESTQDLVRVASAGGTRIAPTLLVRVTGIAEPVLDGALREAVASHILVPQEGAAEERYAFRHALVQEAVYGELLPGERTRLHAAFALALADEAPTDAGSSRAAELAYHWQAAHDLPRAFDAWIQAGIEAEAIYASSEARASFEHALELWDQIPDAAARSPLDRVALLMRAAFHAEGPAPDRSVAYIREAIALVDDTIDPMRAGLLQERLGQYSWNVDSGYAGILAAYREAVRLVPSQPPSAERAWVLAGLGRCYSELERPSEAVALCQEALAVEQAAGDRHVEGRALVVLGRSQVQLGDVEAGLATIARAREVAADLGDVHESANAMTWLAAALHEAGRASEAIAAGLEAEAFASHHGLRARWGTAALERAALALFDLGRWDESAEVLARAQRYELAGLNELIVESQLLRLEALRGQFATANQRAPRVRLLAARYPLLLALAALADLALLQDDPLAARAAVIGVDSPGMQPRFVGRALAAGIRAEADIAQLARSRDAKVDVAECRARGAALMERMRAAYDEVTVHVPGALAHVAAMLATCEAELARVEGMSDPDRWASAAAAWARFEVQAEIGYALMREGEAALAQQRNRPRAARALTEAHAIATRLGAIPLRSAVESLAARAGIALEPANGRTLAVGGEAGDHDKERADPTRSRGRPERVPRGRYELTRREREVLVLVAAGRSDGEIAEALSISKKTASFHVAMIKAKLGARSRVEIATDAIGLGLIEGPASNRT